jgi:hypothetical protein
MVPTRPSVDPTVVPPVVVPLALDVAIIRVNIRVNLLLVTSLVANRTLIFPLLIALIMSLSLELLANRLLLLLSPIILLPPLLADLLLKLPRPVKARLPAPGFALSAVAVAAAVPLLLMLTAAAIPMIIPAVLLPAVLALGRNAEREHAHRHGRQKRVKNALSRHKNLPLGQKGNYLPLLSQSSFHRAKSFIRFYLTRVYGLYRARFDIMVNNPRSILQVRKFLSLYGDLLRISV